MTVEELIQLLQDLLKKWGKDMPVRMRAPDTDPGREGYMRQYEILDAVDVDVGDVTKGESMPMALLHPGPLVAEEH